MTLAGGEVFGVDNAHVGEILSGDTGVVVGHGETGTERDMDHGVILLRQGFKTLLINTDGDCRGGAEVTAVCHVGENIGRLDGYTVKKALGSLVDKKGENLNVVLGNQFRRKVAGAVSSDLDSHKLLPP